MTCVDLLVNRFLPSLVVRMKTGFVVFWKSEISSIHEVSNEPHDEKLFTWGFFLVCTYCGEYIF